MFSSRAQTLTTHGLADGPHMGKQETFSSTKSSSPHVVQITWRWRHVHSSPELFAHGDPGACQTQASSRARARTHLHMHTRSHAHTSKEKWPFQFKYNMCSCQEARNLVSRQPLPHSVPHRCRNSETGKNTGYCGMWLGAGVSYPQSLSDP